MTAVRDSNEHSALSVQEGHNLVEVSALSYNGPFSSIYCNLGYISLSASVCSRLKALPVYRSISCVHRLKVPLLLVQMFFCIGTVSPLYVPLSAATRLSVTRLL